jgi:hypothetical protein
VGIGLLPAPEKGTIMIKKTMLLALAAAALFALPSAASAQEIHFKNVTTFTGSGGAFSLAATNEPKISCTASDSFGGFNAGSTTTGTISLTFSGCTAELLGIKGNCSTASDAGTSFITSSATFHLVTTSTSKPAIVLTPVTTTITCIGFSRVEVTGKGVIGTITSPACGSTSSELSVSFETEGPLQRHTEYTGIRYDLSADTENSAGGTSNTSTAALSGSATLKSATEGTLECT